MNKERLGLLVAGGVLAILLGKSCTETTGLLPRVSSCRAETVKDAEGRNAVVIVSEVDNSQGGQQEIYLSVPLTLKGETPTSRPPDSLYYLGEVITVRKGQRSSVNVATPYFSQTAFKGKDGSFTGHTAADPAEVEVLFSAAVHSQSSPGHH